MWPHESNSLICVTLHPGICAGKQTVADFLVERHGFQQLYLRKTLSTPQVERSASNVTFPHLNSRLGFNDQDRYPFQDASKLLDFVTSSWLERWVTTDIWDENVLEIFQRRPFFLLVSIDAPIILRWERFKDR